MLLLVTVRCKVDDETEAQKIVNEIKTLCESLEKTCCVKGLTEVPYEPNETPT